MSRQNKKDKIWFDDSLSKPTKQCRQAFHKDCPDPKRCPCYCHRQKDKVIK